MMRSLFKVLGVVIASPVVAFFVVAILIYLPPVQEIIKNKVTEKLSAESGLNISIEHVRLAFPLDLSLERTKALDGRDTILVADALRLDVKLLPLFQGKVDVSCLELWRTQVDTRSLLSDLQIKGKVGMFKLDVPATIDLGKKTVDISRLCLNKSRVDIQLSDTAQTDTTQSSPAEWKIGLDQISIEQTDLSLQMPGDSMRIRANLNNCSLEYGRFDLARSEFKVKRVRLKDANIYYDVPQTDSLKEGLDINHLSLEGLQLQLDTFHYSQKGLFLGLPQLSFRERSGLEVDYVRTYLALDTQEIKLPQLSIRTRHTSVDAEAKLAWSVLKTGKGGQLLVKANGTVGESDLRLLTAGFLPDVCQYLPPADLTFDIFGYGNTDLLELKRCQLGLNNFASLRMEGKAGNMTNEKTRYGQLAYDLRTHRMRSYRNLMPAALKERLRIPEGLVLEGKSSLRGDRIDTRTQLRIGKGSVELKGNMALKAENYQLNLLADAFPLDALLPQDSLSALTAKVEASGHGFDPLKQKTHFDLLAAIDQLQYKNIPLDTLQLTAQLKDGKAEAKLTAENRMFRTETNFSADLKPEEVCAELQASLQNLDMLYLTQGKDSIHLMLDVNLKGRAATKGTDMDLHGSINNIFFITTKMGYPAKDINFGFHIGEDYTKAHVGAGDLAMKLQSDKNVHLLLEAVTLVSDELTAQVKSAHFDEKSLTQYLPDLEFSLQSGNDNPLANFMRLRGWTMDSVDWKVKTHPVSGIDGRLSLFNFRTGGLLLEETRLAIEQDSSGVRLKGSIENDNRKNPNRFTATLDGEVKKNGFSVLTDFHDEHHVTGLNLGVKAGLEENGDITLHLFPEESVIAYRKFKVNKNNFFTLGKDNHISADISLMADDDTGFKISTPLGDSTRDVTISIANLNLNELSSVFPILPHLGGKLSCDAHAQWIADTLSAVAQMDLRDFSFEECKFGNLSTEMIYLPNGENEHYVQASVYAEQQEVMNVEGNYQELDGGSIDATVLMTEFPVKLFNGFLSTDGTVALDGRFAGEVHVDGPVSDFQLNGEILSDSLQIFSLLYGVNLKVENKSLSIENSKLKLNDLKMYSISETPLVVGGDLDLRDFSKIKLDMNFKAKDFEIINARQTREAVVYGSVFTDLDATLKGTTDFLIMRGNLKILDKTNMTYVMKDSPLTVEDRLSGLVDFMDFTDTIKVQKDELMPLSGVFVGMNIEVDESAKLHVSLSEDNNSYFNCRGGGSLSMRYFPNGEINLLGRFTMSEGEMKYALPFIPLKTFHLEGDNNYIAFTGDPANPTLHITATETTRASVSEDNNTTRMVTFNVGVQITQTLDNMGLGFIVEAPEDLNVQNDLSSMSKEDKEKVAVSLLATGMYLTSNNKSTFKANNALNAFLQNEIQNIVGDALKTIDLTVGMEGSTSASGNAQTDYSFQFAKHLWNDRVTFKIGGKVTAGSEMASENQSFIDNISLEYRLGNGSSRSLRLFYDHDNVDPLEGTYSSAGAGLVLRKKTNRFSELFIFRNPRRQENKVKNVSNNAQP